MPSHSEIVDKPIHNSNTMPTTSIQLLTPLLIAINNSSPAGLTNAEVSPSVCTPLLPSLCTPHQILYSLALSGGHLTLTSIIQLHIYVQPYGQFQRYSRYIFSVILLSSGHNKISC